GRRIPPAGAHSALRQPSSLRQRSLTLQPSSTLGARTTVTSGLLNSTWTRGVDRFGGQGGGHGGGQGGKHGAMPGSCATAACGRMYRATAHSSPLERIVFRLPYAN